MSRGVCISRCVCMRRGVCMSRDVYDNALLCVQMCMFTR